MNDSLGRVKMSQNEGCPNCEFGWINRKYIDTKTVRLRTGELITTETEYEGAIPCPDCDPRRAQIFASAANPEQLQEALANQSTHKRLEAYRREEDSRTRVL